MHLTISHETIYRYERPVDYSIQILRLTPRSDAGQDVLRWRIVVPGGGRLTVGDDVYGNIVHLLTMERPHAESVIRVEGVVRTRDRIGMIAGTAEPRRPDFFLRQTDRTRPDAALAALAEAVRPGEGGDLARAHRLMLAVRAHIDYRAGATDVGASAAAALAAGAGVCQDHAHVFLSCARLMGMPARYVSGYLATDADEPEGVASHAWAEAWIADLGWVGLDPANAVSPTDAYIRLAVGLDYPAAAPAHGIRRGGGAEALDVVVRVRQEPMPGDA
jgi:transglutaminase-like putative cysteine protease